MKKGHVIRNRPIWGVPHYVLYSTTRYVINLYNEKPDFTHSMDWMVAQYVYKRAKPSWKPFVTSRLGLAIINLRDKFQF